MAGAMILHIRAWREHEPIGGNAAGLRRVAEIAHRADIRIKQPQAAILGLPQEPHPNVEDVGGYLERIVERAENHALFGQTAFGAGRNTIGYFSLRIIGLISVGKTNNFFRVIGLMIGWNYHVVGNDVIEIVGA